jgi:hypothetical protein
VSGDNFDLFCVIILSLKLNSLSTAALVAGTRNTLAATFGKTG